MENKRKETAVLALFSIVLIILAFLPHMQKEMFSGSDDIFHYYRIKSVADGIANGIFPVKLHASAAYGYGYGVGFFYSDALLYIPAVLMAVFHVSLQNAYRVFAFLLYAGVFAGMYVPVRKLTSSRKSAVLAAGIYLFCNKVMESFYLTIAIGQMSALIFAPAAIIGMYLFLTRDKKPYMLIAGFTGLIYCHTISSFLAFCVCTVLVLIYGKELFRTKGKFFHLICAVVIVTGITSAFWLPMLEQMDAQLLKVKAPWTTSEQNVSSWETLLTGRDGLGYVVTFLFVFSVILTGILGKKKGLPTEKRKGAAVLLGIAAGMGWLTTWYPFWHFMNSRLGIKLIQFPVRLNMMTTILIIAAFSILYAEIMKKTEWGRFAGVCILGCGILFSYQEYSGDYLKTDNTKIEQVVNGEVAGLGAGEEWLPMETQREYLTQPDTAVDDVGEAVWGSKEKGCTRFVFEADMSRKYYDIPYVWYKGYRAVDSEGNEFEINKNRETGLVQVWLPKGGSGMKDITVYYAGTKYQILAYVGTIVGILMCVGYVMINSRKEKLGDTVSFRENQKEIS